MADPFSIAAGVTSALGTILKLSFEVAQFVSSVRDASEEMDSVRRELEAITTPLNQLKNVASAVPSDLQRGLSAVVRGCDDEAAGILKQLQSAGAGRNRSVRWHYSGRAEMAKRRSALEAHRSALTLTLMICNL
jgi:hypothetical protein